MDAYYDDIINKKPTAPTKPQAFEKGTGTFTDITRYFGYIKPDDKAYGLRVYTSLNLVLAANVDTKITGKNLMDLYRVGDRVKFTFIHAHKPKPGQQWAATEVSKIENGENSNLNTVFSSLSILKSSSDQDLIRDVRGTVHFLNNNYGFISINEPVKCRAYFDRFSVSADEISGSKNEPVDLGNLFKLRHPVRCDLTKKGGDDYKAVNVVKIEENDGEFSKETKKENSKIQDGKKSIFSTDASTQTDPLLERALLKHMFDDENIFAAVCKHKTDLVASWLRLSKF